MTFVYEQYNAGKYMRSIYVTYHVKKVIFYL